MRSFLPAFKDAWRLSRPYFVSEERWSAIGLLLVILALNLALVGMTVVLNFWNRDFFNAIQKKDWPAFVQLLFLYRSRGAGHWPMPGFCELVVVYILIAVYATYLRQWLQIRWRRWLTRYFLDDWLADRAYYRISLTTDHAAIGTDNPDQRIAEDLRDFVLTTLSLGLDLISNIVTMFSFLSILWGLSGAMALFGIPIPGYMVWVALGYSILGTWLTHLIGRKLVGLNFRRQRVEADFRYALVRIRENIEGVALYGGEQEEKAGLLTRFAAVVTNWRAIMQRTKMLNSLVAGYNQIANIFPIVVAAPRYFAGLMELGDLTQTADAFGQVQGAMSWFVTSYSSIAEWRAIVERLTTFQRAIAIARLAASEGIVTQDAPPGAPVVLRDVTLSLPNGTALLRDADLVLEPGRSVVVTGRSGSGKSTLFRALAGIWPFATGAIERPRARAMFLPQRAYIPLGTLRHAVTYPAEATAYSQAAVEQALTDAGLPGLIARLDQDENWPQLLSGGEQQRLALVRALLAHPDWLFLDEATANLDPESEDELYRTLRARLTGTTIVSIAHRPNLAAQHDRHLVFQRSGTTPGRLLEPEQVGT